MENCNYPEGMTTMTFKNDWPGSTNSLLNLCPHLEVKFECNGSREREANQRGDKTVQLLRSPVSLFSYLYRRGKNGRQFPHNIVFHAALMVCMQPCITVHKIRL